MRRNCSPSKETKNATELAYYLDTSALAKWLTAEAESPALNAWGNRRPGALVASHLTRTELLRVARRMTPIHVQVAHDVLSSIRLLKLSPSVFDLAARLGPARLRSLDALHLASALGLGPDLQAIVTYDKRLAEGALLNDIAVVSPGANLSRN